MKSVRFILFCFVFGYVVTFSAQPNSVKDLGVLVEAKIDSIHGKITLSWLPDTNTYKYYVYKKSVDDSTFALPIAELSGSINQYTDTIVAGIAHEYKIERDGWDYWAYGYIYAGYNLPPVHNRGTALIVCDESLYSSIEDLLIIFKDDLLGDGWVPHIIRAPRTTEFNSDRVLQTKKLIDDFALNDTNLKSIILIGRIAVPYSGSFAVDGHEPEHIGAWPTDVYYAIDGGLWTDTLLNEESNDPRIKNFPNDGKYDQLVIPKTPSYELGRIDLYNLPKFQESEVELLRRYLINNHKYRNAEIVVPDSSIVNDYFGVGYKEGFAASGWSNFTPITGINSFSDDQLRYSVMNKGYLLAYGCGAGSYESVSQVAYTEELAVEPFNATLALLFGSFNGDWDSPNNVLRAVIAAEPLGLAVMWSGRPFWFLHHLAAGYNFGYSTLLSQSSRPDVYSAVSPYSRRFNHIALMGDPTLRLHYHKPPIQIIASNFGDFIKVSWDSVSSGNKSFFVYRSSEEYGEYIPINSEPIIGNEFIDIFPSAGINYYLVRSAEMKYTASGSYLNLSTGVKSKPVIYPLLNENEILRVFPNPADDNINIAFNYDGILNLEIKLFDLKGNLINSNSHYIENSSTNFLNLKLQDKSGNSIPDGTYFLQFKNSELIITEKIIKIRK